MTWEQIIAIEPRVQTLLERVSKPHDQNEFEWAAVKGQITDLVGFFADSDSELLHSSEAYDLVYERILAEFWRGYVEEGSE